MKICEAITDRSQLGQMRLRCQDLEQNINIWRKKSVQLEKQVNFMCFYCKNFDRNKKSSLSLVNIFVVLIAYRYRSFLKREGDRLDLQGRHKHLLCSRCTVFPHMPQVLI